VIVSHLLEFMANKMVLEPLGLTMSGYKIMHILDEHGSVAISRVITCLGSTKSNVSQRLSFLEKNGFVKRSSGDGDDKRTVLVVLTEKGKKKLKEARLVLEKKSLKFDELFSEKELKSVSGFLNKVFDKLIINLK